MPLDPEDFRDFREDRWELLTKRPVFETVWHAWRAAFGWIGLIALRALSIGRYPPRDPSYGQLTLCSSVGLAVLVALVAALIWLDTRPV